VFLIYYLFEMTEKKINYYPCLKDFLILIINYSNFQYEFKSKGIKKNKVNILICTDGIQVSLKRPNKIVNIFTNFCVCNILIHSNINRRF
jgi:hypothetical protein